MSLGNDSMHSASIIAINPSTAAPGSAQRTLYTTDSMTGPANTTLGPLQVTSPPSLAQADGDAHFQHEGDPEVDLQIIEALKSSKDRLYVLKLGEQMESLIQDANARSKFDLLPETTYQRLLVYRCAGYYKLGIESLLKVISVMYTAESRIPSRRLSDLVPAEETAQPTFKIMRRSEQERKRAKIHSQPGSVAGEDGDLSDCDPSEAGSLGGRSSASKKHMTIAEREAAYKEARSRIFMGFEEKEKAKERDTSASSSTLSLVSGSGSTSGGGSVGDLDDAGSTAPTESEWSAPTGRDAKEVRRGGASNGGRSLRSNAPSFNGRASGTSSPAFSYPTLYEPAPTSAAVYDPNQGLPPQHPGGYIAPYPPLYPYPPPGQGPSQYMAPYPYYAQYPYHHPTHHQPNSDPTSPSGTPPDPYGQPALHAHGPYVNPYMWGPPPPPLPGHQHQQYQRQHPDAHHAQSSQPGQHPQPQRQSPPHTAPPAPPAQYPPYPPYMQSPYGAYPIPPYYHPQPPPPPIQQHSAPVYPVDVQRGNGNTQHNGTNGTHNSNSYNRGSPMRNGSTPAATNKRIPPPPPTRSAWSYGPGVTMGGLGFTGAVSVSGPSYYGQNGGETVGPRLSSSMRRTSVASISSSSGGNRTPGDETGSTTSSSTSSSSSRRTFLSTSSKHPLPARPDWAAGLKPNPTLHQPNRHRDNGNNSRTNSPARPPIHLQGQNGQQLPPIFLQATDFPPLSMSSATSEKRPVAGGVWTNPTSARAVLQASPRQVDDALGQAHGNALVQYPPVNGAAEGTRLDEGDRGFERPPLKSSAELFNPKGGMVNGAKRAVQSGDKVEKEGTEKERARCQAIASAIFVDKVAALTLGEQTRDADRREERSKGNTYVVSAAPAAGALRLTTADVGNGGSLSAGGSEDLS